MKRDRPSSFVRIASSAALGGVLLATLAGVGPGPATLPSSDSNPRYQEPPDTVSFAKDILPIFEKRCAKCHGAEDENGEVRTEVSLNLLEYERVMVGSEFGTVIEAGDPDGSFLLDMIIAGDMPEEGDKVPEEEIALIRAWVEAGALNN